MTHNFTNSNWTTFEEIVQEFTQLAQKVNGITIDNAPPLKSKSNHRDNPKFIQRFYRRNRRQAMRLIKEDTKNQCDISFESFKEKFHSGDTPNVDLSIYNDYNPAVSTPNSKPFTVSEVFTKLKNCENTAPDLVKLTYFHLKEVDEDAKVLALIFNICLKAQKIPKAWKISKTVLIPKPGDPSVPEYWRPVSLSSTFYKLFSILLAKRISE